MAYLAAANLLTLVLMGADKRRARRHGERVPEAALFMAAILGGALGGTLGMLLFRHKTKHTAFRLGFPLLLAIQAALCVWYLKGGFGG